MEASTLSTATIAILVAILGSVTAQIAGLLALFVRSDSPARHIREDVAGMNRRLDESMAGVNGRLDQVIREIAEQRERMAKLDGSLEGFLAGRRDRDAA